MEQATERSEIFVKKIKPEKNEKIEITTSHFAILLILNTMSSSTQITKAREDTVPALWKHKTYSVG
ncbi:MAG: hypothetical protein MZV63_05965 [Marinilabiliales bacterium]|nr:hypothetical protein [Marinilabiliales bacterium]